jgi:hypothetical protein
LLLGTNCSREAKDGQRPEVLKVIGLQEEAKRVPLVAALSDALEQKVFLSVMTSKTFWNFIKGKIPNREQKSPAKNGGSLN